MALTLLPSSVFAQQGTLRQQLVGTWSLVSCDYKSPVCSSNATGSISFGGDGRYTEVVLGGGRPRITVGGQDRTAVTPDQYKAIGQGTAAQFGTWSVNEADKTLTQHAESSFFGAGSGSDVKLNISFTGDELKTVFPSGSSFTWKKTPPPQQTLQ